MSRAEWFVPKFKWLKRLAWLGVLGLVVFLLGFRFDDRFVGHIISLAGFFGLVPLVFWFSFLPILHWRDRYRGNHPNLWGGLMVFETTGWTRLVYWFAHLLRDYRAAGRYADQQ